MPASMTGSSLLDVLAFLGRSQARASFDLAAKEHLRRGRADARARAAMLVVARVVDRHEFLAEVVADGLHPVLARGVFRAILVIHCVPTPRCTSRHRLVSWTRWTKALTRVALWRFTFGGSSVMSKAEAGTAPAANTAARMIMMVRWLIVVSPLSSLRLSRNSSASLFEPPNQAIRQEAQPSRRAVVLLQCDHPLKSQTPPQHAQIGLGIAGTVSRA